MSDRLIVAVVFIAAFMLTWLLRRYALAGRLMDIPNERSSHSIPTPRGGGVAIVLIFLTVLLVMGSLQWLPWRFIIGIVGAGVFR
jgi:Fuc2NAc and GlcNAc transferase